MKTAQPRECTQDTAARLLAGLPGLRALIVGAAREGTALARFLAARGARVTLADNKPAAALSKYLTALEGLTIEYALGTPAPDLHGFDVVFLSPGVPPSAPLVVQARALGLPLSSEPRVVTQLLHAPVVGITGSSGKTTTTALTGRMFAAAGRDTWVGGNIGFPLIEKLHESPQGPDVAVMELSSFQLELFAPEYQSEQVNTLRSEASRMLAVQGWSPRIAAITNITPNHLDRHASMEDYVLAKSRILAYQETDDWAVLNAEDDWSARLTPCGRVLQFALAQAVEQGAFLAGDRLMVRDGGREQELCKASDVRLRGRHNLANSLTAACCALAGGVPIEAMRTAVTTFGGVAHRLEIVRQRDGVLWVNDSIATTPERAMAALRAFNEPIVLLAGGRDKHLPWEDWAVLVGERARVVVAFGEAAPIIERALSEVAAGTRLEFAQSLSEAVSRAAALARSGDVVLLSPGGTSFDAYDDFEARGKHFGELVRAL
jgi:UDP-N-acetylmuramoylalanine--D-glutamate ligase